MRIGGNLLASGRVQSAFAAAVRPKLGDEIEWLAKLNDSKEGKFLRGADALRLSIGAAEAFGLAVAKALSCGTPVVAACGWSTPEVLRHVETGFRRHDEAEMLQALQRIRGLDRPSGRQACVESYSETRAVSECMALVDEQVR